MRSKRTSDWPYDDSFIVEGWSQSENHLKMGPIFYCIFVSFLQGCDQTRSPPRRSHVMRNESGSCGDSLYVEGN